VTIVHHNTVLADTVARRITRSPPGQRWVAGPLPGSVVGVGWGAGYDWCSVTPGVALATVVERGSADWVAQEGQGTNHAGSTMVLDAGTLHRGWGQRDSVWAMLFVPRPAFDALAGRRVGAIQAAQVDDRLLREALLGLVDMGLERRTGSAARDAGRALAEAVAANLEVTAASAMTVGPTDLATRVREAIDATYRDTLPLDELVRPLGVTVETAIRAFTRRFGVSPHQYRIQRRLSRAAEALARNAPVTEVAFDEGFADGAHLSRLFKRQFHVTPQRFRGACAGQVPGRGAYSEIATQ